MSAKRKRVVGVIPARYASTRLPGKSLVSICGKPLIQWVVENAAKARMLDDLLVATDDQRICEAARKAGAKAAMTKPDHPSGTDRIAEAVQSVQADIVINIQGDEPLIDPNLIDEIAKAMLACPELDMATAATPIVEERDLAASSVVKVVWNENGHALYFSRSPIPFVRDNDLDSTEPLHWRHIGIYAYTKSFLARFVKTPPCALERAEKLEQLRALYLGARIMVVAAKEAGMGVDTPEDVKRVEEVLRQRRSA